VVLGRSRPGRGSRVPGFWTAGYFGLSYVGYGSALFPPYVAILDVVLVFLIFKSDVRLT